MRAGLKRIEGQMSKRVTIPNLEALYLQGNTLRQLAQRFSLNFRTIHHHLRKSKTHHRTVSKVLRARCIQTLDITPARKGKLARAIYRRERPKQYQAWLKSLGPNLPNAHQFGREYRADCPKCMNKKSVYANKSGSSWKWKCSSCDEQGLTK